MAARNGAHLLGVPRDNLPILADPATGKPLWRADSPWTAVSPLRAKPGAKKALLAFGATAFVAAEAADKLAADGIAADAWVVNGLPLDTGRLGALFRQYPEGLVTIEDGLIGTPEKGIRGFAGLVPLDLNSLQQQRSAVVDAATGDPGQVERRVLAGGAILADRCVGDGHCCSIVVFNFRSVN